MNKDEALDLALEALEVEQTEVAMFNLVPKPHITKAITAIKQARSAPVQEPVAKVDANDEGYWADILPDRTVKVGQFLYAAAQRQWVGLTDEEIDKTRFAIQTKAITQRDHELSRAIEAKLKEKNI